MSMKYPLFRLSMYILLPCATGYKGRRGGRELLLKEHGNVVGRKEKRERKLVSGILMATLTFICFRYINVGWRLKQHKGNGII